MEHDGQETKVAGSPDWFNRMSPEEQEAWRKIGRHTPDTPKYIYIAGPLNVDSDDEKVNVQNAIILAQTIIEMGGVPYLPHLTLFWDKQFRHPKDYWMKLDIQWLLKCDAVYRMYGNSDGADAEVQAAITATPRIPVLFTYPSLLDFIRGGN